MFYIVYICCFCCVLCISTVHALEVRALTSVQKVFGLIPKVLISLHLSDSVLRATGKHGNAGTGGTGWDSIFGSQY